MLNTKSATAALLAALWAQAQAQPPRLYIATEYSPPASMREGGVVTGISTDKVRELMARAGIDYTIDLLPWKRAYTGALQRPDACVFSTTRTPERESLFRWIGPLDETEWVLMGRAGRDYGLATLDEAHRYRIGTYNGDAREQYLRARGFAVDSAQDDLTNPRKLLLGRIDLWAASLRNGSAVLRQHGWSGRIVPVLAFNKFQVYLACNRQLPDAQFERLSAAAGEMWRDGTMHRIEQAWAGWTPPPARHAPAPAPSAR